MTTMPMGGAELRKAIKDSRFWQRGHPEHDGYRKWVNDGWRALSESPDGASDGVVQVRAYERRGHNGDIVQVQAHSRSAPPRAWESQPNAEWRARVAREETNRDGGDFGYGVRGSIALGRYQMTPPALAGAGWKVNGQWTDRAVANGTRIRTDQEFLSNATAQEAALNDYLRDNEVQLRRNGAWARIGSTVPGLRDGPVPLTAAGLAAAAHREGAPAVARYLAHRDRRDPIPPSISGRGDLARFNQVEARLRAFAKTPCVPMAPR